MGFRVVASGATDCENLEIAHQTVVASGAFPM